MYWAWSMKSVPAAILCRMRIPSIHNAMPRSEVLNQAPIEAWIDRFQYMFIISGKQFVVDIYWDNDCGLASLEGEDTVVSMCATKTDLD